MTDQDGIREVWLPADLTVVLLHQEATARGNVRLRIKQSTLRQWVRRGHIRYDRSRGYDIASIIAYVTGRGARGQRKLAA